MSIEFACPGCGKKYSLDEKQAGKQAKCPQCEKVFTVPPPEVSGSELDDFDEYELEDLDDPPASPSMEGALGDLDDLDDLDDLSSDSGMDADLDSAAAATPAPDSAPKSSGTTCPNCDAALQPGAVLCTSCGYHLKEQRKVEGLAAPAGKKKEKASPLAALSAVPKKYLAIGGGVLGAIVIAGLVFAFLPGEKKPSGKQTAQPDGGSAAAPAGTDDTASPPQPAKIEPGEFALAIDAEYKTLRTGSRTANLTSRKPLLQITATENGFSIESQGQSWKGEAADVGELNLAIPMTQVLSQFPGLPGTKELTRSKLLVTWNDGQPAAKIEPVPEWVEGTKQDYAEIERGPNPPPQPRAGNTASGLKQWVYFGQKDGFTRLECRWVDMSEAAANNQPDRVAGGILLPPLGEGSDEVVEPLDPTSWEDRPPAAEDPPGQAAQFVGHGFPVTDFALLSDDRLLTAGSDGTARVWNLATGEEVARFVVPEFNTGFDLDRIDLNGRAVLAASADATRIVSSSGVGFDNCAVRLWDLSDGLELPTSLALEKKLREQDMSPEEQRQFSLIYGESALRSAMSNTRNGYRARSVQVSADGKWVLIEFSDGVGRVYDASTGAIAHEVAAGGGIRLLGDDKHLLAGSRLLELGTWKPAADQAPVRSIAEVARVTGQPIRFAEKHQVMQVPGKTGSIQLLGHESSITCLDYSGDGRFIVTGSEDGTVRVWDAATARQLRRYQCYPESFAEQPADKQQEKGARRPATKEDYRVLKVAFLPDGKRVLSTDTSGGVRLWNLADNDPRVQPLYQISHMPFTAPVEFEEIALDSSGRYLQVNRKLISDLKTGLVVYLAEQEFLAMTDGLLKANNGEQIIEVASGNVVAEFEDRIQVDSHAAAFDATGTRFVSGHCPQGRAGEITLWDAESGESLKQFLGHTGSLSDIAFLPDGKRFVSSSQDKQVLLWDIASGKSIALDEDMRADRLVVSPDGSLVAGISSGVFRVWDTANRTKVFGLDRVTAAVFTPDGRHLVVTDVEQRHPQVYETKTWGLVFEAGAIPPSAALAVTADGKVVLAAQNARRRGREESAGGIQAIHLPDRFVGKSLVARQADPLVIRPPLKLVRTIALNANEQTKELFEAAESFRFLPDGRHAMIGTKENRAGIVDMQTGKTVCFLDGVTFREIVTTATPWAHVAEGKLAAASSTGRISRWDLKTGVRQEELLAEVENDDKESTTLTIESATFADDGASAALLSSDKGPYLVDMRAMQPVGAAAGEASRRGKSPVQPPPEIPKSRNTRGPKPLSSISLLAGIPGNDDVLVCDRSGQIAIINGRSGRPTSRFEGLSRAAEFLAACDSGDKFLAIDSEGTLRVWSRRNSAVEFEVETGSRRNIACATLPGTALAVTGQNGQVTLWDLDEGKSLGQVYLVGEEDLRGIGFYATGKHVFTLTDSELRIWEIVR